MAKIQYKKITSDGTENTTYKSARTRKVDKKVGHKGDYAEINISNQFIKSTKSGSGTSVNPYIHLIELEDGFVNSVSAKKTKSVEMKDKATELENLVEECKRRLEGHIDSVDKMVAFSAPVFPTDKMGPPGEIKPVEYDKNKIAQRRRLNKLSQGGDVGVLDGSTDVDGGAELAWPLFPILNFDNHKLTITPIIDLSVLEGSGKRQGQSQRKFWDGGPFGPGGNYDIFTLFNQNNAWEIAGFENINYISSVTANVVWNTFEGKEGDEGGAISATADIGVGKSQGVLWGSKGEKIKINFNNLVSKNFAKEMLEAEVYVVGDDKDVFTGGPFGPEGVQDMINYFSSIENIELVSIFENGKIKLSFMEKGKPISFMYLFFSIMSSLIGANNISKAMRAVAEGGAPFVYPYVQFYVEYN